MKKVLKQTLVLGILALFICVFSSFAAFAASNDNTASTDSTVTVTATSEKTEASAEADSTGSKAVAAAICVGLAAAAGAVGMGLAIAKSAEGISRQPEAEGKIRTSLMLGLVFIETAIIYALIIAILIIFVL